MLGFVNICNKNDKNIKDLKNSAVIQNVSLQEYSLEMTIFGVYNSDKIKYFREKMLC